MSILPTQFQGSASSSSLESPPLNPNYSSHGSPPQSRSPRSLQSQFQPQSQHLSGESAPVTEESSGSSTEVNELGTTDSKRSWAHQNAHTNSLSQSGVGGVECVQSKGKMSGNIASPQSQQSVGSVNSRGGTTHASGRRAQMTNANHLLNFHYDPISRPQPRAPPPRRPQRKRAYNKDLFLQANYKFIVLDTGSYAPESMDPDKMLKWEDIICVRYSTTFPVQCPICLEYPLCPQITSCGHIFCFPCILRYLLMGEEDQKGDCFKRCPLCFVMISPKDLYTIYIENVKQYCIGETIEFMLLTRQKHSFVPSKKIKPEADTALCCNDNIYDPFSKFTFTSDVELSVRKAISDLDSWLVRADSGLVDDLEKLPYVCAAMEQLEKRKKYWNEQKACCDDRFNVSSSQKGSQGLLPTLITAKGEHKAWSSGSATPSIDINNKNKGSDNVMGGVAESPEDEDSALSSSYEENKNFQKHANGYRDVKDKDSYNFYQAIDGQHLILHPLNMKCLLHHYGSYDLLPHRVSGTILQLETATQSEAMRRRYRYLSHFSLTTTFQLCEIDLNAAISPNALIPFMDEIKKREKLRKQLANKEWKEKIKAEAAASASMPSLPSFGQSSYDTSPNFSMEDFEALGISSSMSSSPPVAGERLLFSNVARFGFAAGHGSPALKIEENVPLQNNKPGNNYSNLNGSINPGPSSFANVTARPKSEENPDPPKMNEASKKGKRPNRVLLSTTGGRRY
uniref:RING-type domain-containing protein n=1 Tax=Salix viminalis TaxID=40686 RepID=A0A6N2M979_SALVM